MPGPNDRGSDAARRARQRMLRRLAAHERQLGEIWARAEDQIRGVVRSIGGNEAEVLQRLRPIVERTFRARRRTIERSATDAARIGHEAGADVAHAAFPGLAEVAPMPPSEAVDLALEHLSGRLAPDGIRLSDRLHATQGANLRAMSAELADTIRRGDSVQVAAQRLLEVDDARVHLPRYLTDLRSAVRGGDAQALRRTVRNHIARVDRLADPTLRAAGRELIRAAHGATAEDIDRQIRYWVRDRALYQERVIARTESARVYTAAFQESTSEQPWTKGYRWNLSAAHPRTDICDIFASQAIDGMGPGGYLPGSVPECPAHPNCLCFLTSIIDERHFERDVAEVTEREAPAESWRDPRRISAEDVIRRLPAVARQELLGPTRSRIFDRDPAAVVGPRGQLAPVWQAAGHSAPASRTLGPAVRVRNADPFGEAGSRVPRTRAAVAARTARRRR